MPSSSLSDDALLGIRFDQKIGAEVETDLQFRDEAGRLVQLGDYFGEKPTILVLGYYECPMLCTLVLNGIVECLLGMRMDIGKEFQVMTVSIDPREGPALAAAKKRTYVRRYGRPRAASGWHFLTGEEIAIRRLADQVGFRYAYDPVIRQYAHPSGFIVLTPHGKVARYFFGLTFSPKDLSVTLREAVSEQTGSVVEQLFLLCFHYSPLRGPYGALIMTVLRLAGLATVLTIVTVMWRGRHPRQRVTAGVPLPTPAAPATLAPALRDPTREDGP